MSRSVLGKVYLRSRNLREDELLRFDAMSRRIFNAPSFQDVGCGQQLDAGAVCPRARFEESGRRGLGAHRPSRIAHRDEHPHGRALTLDHTSEVAYVGRASLTGLHGDDHLPCFVYARLVEVEPTVDPSISPAPLVHRIRAEPTDSPPLKLHPGWVFPDEGLSIGERRRLADKVVLNPIRKVAREAGPPHCDRV